MSHKEKPSYCAQCQSACPILCTVEDSKLLGIRPDENHPNASPLCPKGLAGPELVYHSLRLKHPLKRTRPKGASDPGWQRISWQEAFRIISEKLSRIKEKYGPHSVVFNRPGPGGSPSRDYAPYVVRLANAFGSPNALATGHVCQWHRDTGSKYTFGWQKPPEPDYEHTRMVIVWGHNSHASIRCNVRDISNAIKRGAKLIVVDPRRTRWAEKADLWLQIRPGTDTALLLAAINILIRKNGFDREFVKNWTNAPFLVDSTTGNLIRSPRVSDHPEAEAFFVWDKHRHRPCAYRPDTGTYEWPDVDPKLLCEVDFKHFDGKTLKAGSVFSHLKAIAEKMDTETASKITGIPQKNIRTFSDMIIQNRPACYYSYNGLEQHTHATQTNRALCIFYALTGNLDKRGGNVFFPSIPSPKIKDADMLSADSHALRLGHDKRPLGPAGNPNSSAQAYEVFETLLSDKPYPLKALVAFGGNIITANAHSLKARKALRKLDFYVQTELFMTPSAELSDIVLPAATFYESPALKLGFPNTLACRQRIQYRPAVISPLYESKPDIEIIFELAKCLNLSEYFWESDIDTAFNDLLRYTNYTLEALKQHPHGVSIPLKIVHKKYGRYDPGTRAFPGFKTPSKRLEIFSQTFKNHGFEALPTYREPAVSPFSRPELRHRYPLILTCNKLLHFCHGQHRAIPSLRKAVPHPFIEINPAMAIKLEIENGEWVSVETPHGKIRCRAHVTEGIAYDVVSIQHGWWQSCPQLGLPGYDPYSSLGANANLLYTTDEIDPISGSVPYKSYMCRLTNSRETSRKRARNT